MMTTLIIYVINRTCIINAFDIIILQRIPINALYKKNFKISKGESEERQTIQWPKQIIERQTMVDITLQRK